ncbi:hypothetical protein ACHWQZ_G014759 [Mnemiopsis leidyi]
MSHGVDGITNEQLKYGEGALLIHLEHMFKKVWKDEIPDDWLNGVIIIIRISNLLQAFFNGIMSAVRVNGELTDWFDVNSGMGQGDIQGPPVFNFCLNFAAYVAEANNKVSHGIVLQKQVKKSEEMVVLNTDYADDMAFMYNSTDGLQESTDLLAHYCSYAGLRINAKKTQCMAVSKSASQRPYNKKDCIDLEVGGEPVEQVSNFV